MSIINGILKNKNGDTLYPETSFEKVIDTNDSKTLKEWRTETDSSLASLGDLVDGEGLVKMSKLPSILNKFKGTFSSEGALPETGEAGDYAICTDTDTVWIWDEEKSGGAGWIDTGNKGSVTSVNSKTGDVVIGISDIDGLQTSLDAKLTTDDIVDDLATGGTGKALSAAQGVVLNSLITTVKSTAEEAQSAAASAQSAASQAQTAASSAASAAATAQSTAEEVDFAIVENGGSAPDTLREDGVYFEIDA